MESNIYLHTIMVLFLVIAFMIGVLWLLRYLMRQSGNWTKIGLGLGKKQDRLAVLETLVVDGKNRLVLVRCDEVEHLLLLGSETGLVVESKIISKPETELMMSKEIKTL